MIEATPQGGDLQLEGPPMALNIAKGLRDLTPTSYHEFWLHTAGIPRGDRSVYENECLSCIFERMICIDQLNPSGLQFMELVVRRMQVIREAHRVSPSAPDYSSADYFHGLEISKSESRYRQWFSSTFGFRAQESCSHPKRSAESQRRTSSTPPKAGQKTGVRWRRRWQMRMADLMAHWFMASPILILQARMPTPLLVTKDDAKLFPLPRPSASFCARMLHFFRAEAS